MSRSTRRAVRLALRILVVAVAAFLGCDAAWAQDPVTDFKQNCSSCHTIGGGALTGPDLKDVTKRKDRPWLVRFIVDPAALLDAGDPYALKLLKESPGGATRMPNIAGMSRKRAELLMDLIEAESKLEKSRFAGIQISDRPFTAADIALGRELFTGETQLTNGGAACISCHTLGGLGGFGGGRLGPDLTKVYERYENRRKLGAWLSAPATVTMLPTFKQHPIEVDEILPLVAYFENAAKFEQEDTSPSYLVFILLGLGGTAVVLVLFNRIWTGRFHGVRRPLVKGAAVGLPDLQGESRAHKA